jgi:SAM-dependent methyltransferase
MDFPALHHLNAPGFGYGERSAPYASLAPLYNALLGRLFFPKLRRAFAWVVRRYRVRFSSAADAACGTGTFLRYLQRRGVARLYGVDRSAAMLRVALAKSGSGGICYLRQDFAHLQLPEPVDLLTCNFDSLNYLLTPGELLKALRRFRENLKAGGFLVFDMITLNQPWSGLHARDEHVLINGARFWRSMRLDPRSGLQTSRVRIIRGGRSFEEVHRQRAYPVAMVVRLLGQAGFELLGAHDFDSLQAPGPLTRRVVYVARNVDLNQSYRLSSLLQNAFDGFQLVRGEFQVFQGGHVVLHLLHAAGAHQG